MKRIVTLLLALMMVLGTASLTVFAESTLIETDIVYSVDNVTVEEDATEVTVGVWITNLTDEDDLGTVDLKVGYDQTKLQQVDLYATTGTGRNQVYYGAACFEGGYQFSEPGSTTANPLTFLAWTTAKENPCYDSVYEMNTYEFAFIDFEILGDWTGTTELVVTNEMTLRRSDDAEMSVICQNGSITRGEPVRVVPQNDNFDTAYAWYRDFDAMADEYFNPTFWNAFEGFINYGLEIIETGTQEELDAHADSGVNGAWFWNRIHFKSTAGINATTGGSAATVNGTGTVIPAATPVLLNYDRLYVSHADATGTNVAWSNSATIVTKAGMNVSDITSFGGATNTTAWRVYICEPTGVADYYKLINLGGNTSTTRPVIPEGGFAIVTHTNSKNNTNVNTASHEYAKYNSGLFWARNVHAVYAAGLSNGGYLKATGITIENGVATIDTEGTWLTYKDPALNGGAGDHVYRTGYITLDTADEQGRTTATRDAFAGFRSNAYIQGVSALPGETVTVATSGEGTVSAVVDGTTVPSASINTLAGSTITLTADGEDFMYWIDGNNTILSTEAVLTIPGGKALNLTAVFGDLAEATTYNVYFKDSKTGKVIATKSVEAGTALDTTDVTASMKGYTFTGWTVENGTVINATTEVYAIYEKDTATEITITVVRDGKTLTYKRTYGAIALVTANDEGFAYWTLNGAVVSVNSEFQFSTPSEDCTLEAVCNVEAPTAVVATVDASKVGSTIYYLMSRSVEEGAEIVETGVLMTRKATAADLTVDTTVNTVTRGVSSAADNYDVVGFRKDAEGKAGTWLVRGYLTYTVDGATSTIYTDVASIVIE